MTTRFRIEDAAEILRDPGGHFHHFSILIGVLVEGELRVGDLLAVPRAAGGHWLSRVIGFDRFREQFGERIDAAGQGNRPLGVGTWGLAPPQGTVALGEARLVTGDEARALLEVLERDEPGRVAHCADCARVREVRTRSSPRG